MEQTKSIEIWKRYFGEAQVAYDYAAQPMKLEDFENENSNYGWTIDLIKPLSNGGMITDDNLIPCSMLTKNIRGDKMSFKIGNGIFEVRKGKKFRTFAIYDVTDFNHPLDRTPSKDDLDTEKVLAYHKKLYGTNGQTKHFILPNLKNIRDKVFSENTVGFEFEEETNADNQNLDQAPVFNASQVETSLSDEKILKEVNPETITKNIEQKEVVEEVDLGDKEEILDDKEISDIVFEGEPVEITEEEEEDTLSHETILTDGLEKEVTSVDIDVVDPFETETEIVHEEKKEEISSEEEETELLLTKVADLTDEKNILIQEKEELKTNYESLLSSFEEIKTELGITRNSLVSAKELIATLAQAKDNLSGAKEQLLVDLENVTKEKCHMKQQIQELNQQMKELGEANRFELDGLLDSYKAKAETLMAKSINDETEINRLNKQVEELSSQLAECKSSYQNVVNEKENLSQEITDWKMKVETLTDEKDALSLQKEDYMHKVLLLEKNQEEVLTLKEASLNEKEEETEKLKQQLQEQTLQLEKMAQELKEQKEKLEKCENDENTLRDTISSLNVLISEREQQVLLKEKAQETQREELLKELETLKQTKEALEAEKTALLEEKAREEEEDKLASERFDSIAFERDEFSHENAQLKENLEVLTSQVSELSSLKEEQQQELEQLKEEKQALESKSAQEGLKLEEYEKEFAALRLANESSLLENKSLGEELVTLKEKVTRTEEELETTQKKNKALEMKLIYVSLGGDLNFYDEMTSYLSENALALETNNIEEALLSHTTWVRKDNEKVYDLNLADNEVEELGQSDVSYVDEEIKNEAKAYDYWDEIIGEEKDFVTDFAGRLIRKKEFNIKNSDYGWNYRVINPRYEENKNNVVIGNLLSLQDMKEESFSTNGKEFNIVEDAKGFQIVSDDFITDPYNTAEALEVAKRNEKKTTKLIYIFVKCTSSKEDGSDNTKEKLFYDLIDRTAQRTCPRSFLEMKTTYGKNGYVFLTFDGQAEGAYKEALNYAVLLNTYRFAMKKKFADEFNAYIVLNQLEVPLSLRHMNFEQLILASKNIEMKALQYDFILTPIINSTIKKSLHIGPSIIDKLPLDSSALKDSAIGHSYSFSEIYHFNGKYSVYNFIFRTNDNK